jgi:hypothetical protein
MDTVDKIATVIPKLKYQLLFLKEREKLFEKTTFNTEKEKENEATYNNSSDFPLSSTSPSSLRLSSELLSDLSQQSHTVTHVDAMLIPKELIDVSLNVPFPNEYVVPPLPASLVNDIENGATHKFGPHHANRQILIDIVCHDLLNKYNLW